MIDYKNPAELREWLDNERQKAGLWRIYESTSGNLCVEPAGDTARDLIKVSVEALPYWIARAEAAERAVERLAKLLGTDADCCPYEDCDNDIITRNTPMEELHQICAACCREWAMKEDNDNV